MPPRQREKVFMKYKGDAAHLERRRRERQAQQLRPRRAGRVAGLAAYFCYALPALAATVALGLGTAWLARTMALPEGGAFSGGVGRRAHMMMAQGTAYL